MRNLTPRQTIAVGVAALFGIPICAGIAIGYVLGFWVGLLVTVVSIAGIAFIAMRWWQRRAGDDKKNRE